MLLWQKPKYIILIDISTHGEKLWHFTSYHLYLNIYEKTHIFYMISEIAFLF